HPPIIQRPQIIIPLTSDIDHLQSQILNSEPPSLHDILLEVYGHAHQSSHSSPLKAYTDGSCINGNTPSARAGLGIYYSPNHPLNLAARVPGPQRNNRAELYAILVTIQRSQPKRSLDILTDSTYAIQSLTHNAGENTQYEWDCKNGDLLKVIAQWVASRPAPIYFTHVRAHSGNAHNDEADRLAKHG
ncbi:ribonuclease H-like domain-containing protein, partial [Lentinula lateritia]